MGDDKPDAEVQPAVHLLKHAAHTSCRIWPRVHRSASSNHRLPDQELGREKAYVLEDNPCVEPRHPSLVVGVRADGPVLVQLSGVRWRYDAPGAAHPTRGATLPA